MTLIDNSTIVTSNSTIDSRAWLIQLSLWPLRIVCPLLIIICPTTNWACIRVFQSRIYARSSSKWYFIYIAIFDTIYVLVTAPLIFLLTLGIYILNWNILLCKLMVFFNYLSCQISAGLLACLSIDRLIATSCLSVYRQNCTTNLSKFVCLAVILILSILNSHYLIGYTIDSNGFCSVRHYEWYEANYSRFIFVYLLSYSIIPFTIITICNLFIAISVCQNKTNLRKKYEIKKPISALNIHHEKTPTPKCSILICDQQSKILKFDRCSTEKDSVNDNTHDMFVSSKDKQVINKILDTNADWRSHGINGLSEKSLLHHEESFNLTETSSTLTDNRQFHIPTPRERSSSAGVLASSGTNSQKMCAQLQITISLIAISICFIFCTLPNCISTIMIQTYSNNEHVREVWQAMNYLSIVPLLITHSVNFLFYYLSSNMFRERFKEYYFKKKNSI